MPKGVWTLWADVPEPARGQLRAIFRELRVKYKPRGRLSRTAAKLVAELVFTTAAASEAGVRVVVKREQGKGRRPTTHRVNSALRRQGVQIESLDRMLPGGLAELLVGRNGHGRSFAERLLAVPPVAQERAP